MRAKVHLNSVELFSLTFGLDLQIDLRNKLTIFKMFWANY